VQDPLPETRAGNFDRGLDASNINQVISNYNYTYAGPVRRQNQEMSRLRFPATTFNGWALAGECSVAWLPAGATRSFESGSGSGLRDTSRQRNTHSTESREVRYPWHPWHDRVVTTHRSLPGMGVLCSSVT